MAKFGSHGGASGPAPPGLRRNTIIDALPDAVWTAWLPHLEIVELAAGSAVYELGNSLPYVWFPIDSAIAVMQTLADGASAQVAVVGHEGLIGAPIFLGASLSRTRAIVQSAGRAGRISADFVVREFERGQLVMQLLLRHTQAIIAQMAQIAACNRHHAPEQQFCRWLLMAMDRFDEPELHVTQEQIATMLGVRRETISDVARKLQGQGLVEGRRGLIRPLDRDGLERRACECYSSIVREYARLFPRKP